LHHQLFLLIFWFLQGEGEADQTLVAPVLGRYGVWAAEVLADIEN
jgi:hypothetical protein